MTYSGTLSWETAFTDVVAVLKIQYRHDSDVSSFLNDSDKVRLLTYSSIARMEYNRRCIREELEFETYSPPRARRIAKEVAVDYIKKWIDGEEEKIEMFKKFDDLRAERDSVVANILKVEDENIDLRREKNRLIIANSEVKEQKEACQGELDLTKKDLESTRKTLHENSMQNKDLQLSLANAKVQLENSKAENKELKEDIANLKSDFAKARKDNDELRNECQAAWKESAERRDEISHLKGLLEAERAAGARAAAMAESLRKQNEDLNMKNNCIQEKNLNLRDQVNVFKAREEEMRTLVNIQSSILTDEKVETKNHEEKDEEGHEVEVEN